MPFYKQPIVHFLAIGILLFVFFNVLNPDRENDGTTIVVDNDALLEYMQYRNRAFNPEQSRAMLDRLDREERRDLVSQLAREEALYREALAMAFDRDDYVIKQRLIQKIEYLSQGYQPESANLDRQVVAEYFDDHRDRYREPPTVTFTHVFVSSGDRAEQQSRQMAAELLAQLQADQVGFSQAMGFGERFLYYTNYVERSAEFVASHFGAGFSERVFTLGPDNQWHGPIKSDHGYHLVMVSGGDPGGVPALDEIYARVAGDARQALLDKRQEEALDRIVAKYTVVDKTGGGERGVNADNPVVSGGQPE